MTDFTLTCFFCSATLGTIPSAWISGRYFTNIPYGIASGFPLVYVDSSCAGLCTNCQTIIQSYNLCDSDPQIQIAYCSNQIGVVSAAVLAITSLESEYIKMEVPIPKFMINQPEKVISLESSSSSSTTSQQVGTSSSWLPTW